LLQKIFFNIDAYYVSLILPVIGGSESGGTDTGGDEMGGKETAGGTVHNIM
jgi:hypothetical protein